MSLSSLVYALQETMEDPDTTEPQHVLNAEAAFLLSAEPHNLVARIRGANEIPSGLELAEPEIRLIAPTDGADCRETRHDSVIATPLQPAPRPGFSCLGISRSRARREIN